MVYQYPTSFQYDFGVYVYLYIVREVGSFRRVRREHWRMQWIRLNLISGRKEIRQGTGGSGAIAAYIGREGRCVFIRYFIRIVFHKKIRV